MLFHIVLVIVLHTKKKQITMLEVPLQAQHDACFVCTLIVCLLAVILTTLKFTRIVYAEILIITFQNRLKMKDT